MMAINSSGCSAIGMASFSSSAALSLAGAAGGGAPLSAGVADVGAGAGGTEVAAAGAADVAPGAEGVAVAAGEDPGAAGGVWLLATPTQTTAAAKTVTVKRRQVFIYAISTLQTF